MKYLCSIIFFQRNNSEVRKYFNGITFCHIKDYNFLYQNTGGLKKSLFRERCVDKEQYKL